MYKLYYIELFFKTGVFIKYNTIQLLMFLLLCVYYARPRKEFLKKGFTLKF